MTSSAASLYIHVPFCRSKCAYCAFCSFTPRAGQVRTWLECVGLEIGGIIRSLTEGTKFSTVYIGGGTPSFLTVEEWKELLSVTDRLPVLGTCEFTVEANPDSLSHEKISLWQDHGINRVSIGVQSLDDRELKLCGRPHTAREALDALCMSLDAGLRVSADLIFGLPGQTLRKWHENMSGIVDAGVKHISVYQLMIEPESLWGRRTPSGLPDGYPMYRWAQYYLPAKGLEQYEIASFAVCGEESRHNCAYWKRSSVYAAGPAAWGFLDGRRFGNTRDFDRWASCVRRGASAVDHEEQLTGAARASEAAVLALRMRDGIGFCTFAARYGQDWLDEILDRLRGLPEKYLVWNKDRVALSPAGMRVGNAIWAELMDLDG